MNRQSLFIEIDDIPGWIYSSYIVRLIINLLIFLPIPASLTLPFRSRYRFVTQLILLKMLV